MGEVGSSGTIHGLQVLKVSKPKPRGRPCQGFFLVSDFILPNAEWDLPKLLSSFDPNQATAISKIPLTSIPRSDFWIWSPASNGKFSTKSAYLTDQKTCLQNHTALSSVLWNKLWAAHIHPRHKIMWWQAILDILPTKCRIARVVNIENITCPV
ncbi:hypothetical protein PanWU01x14_367940 [Parasponia andersonii]|uniref:Reverse transcriptase zinc-binding domain-containing protein n=1 Tax=Parasponia andersonii TaxID=3476 RepID=A0A2P5A581_PARAD|nr:hypothetical protein PanWU01x14_367940 [Parasponia andersonii]